MRTALELGNAAVLRQFVKQQVIDSQLKVSWERERRK